MPGMQFEYDEKGGTFYYFLLSFVALILIPATYYLWPSDEEKDKTHSKQKQECYCEPCKFKRNLLKKSEPWKHFKRRSIKFSIILGWIFVVFLAYKTSQVELDFSEFDPFGELGIDREASTAEIKKAYRQLTLIHHPDKGGDERKFLKIAKAYQALTDDEARKNWEEHGNPDGPGATHFGIALPKWIVEKQNSMWVLAVYGLVFMVLLPVVVGTWWYRTIQYSAEQILMDTTQLYYYLFHKTPNMNQKRVIMILGASFEFESGHNQEIVARRSDNEEIPALMRDLPNLNEKNKERPLCCPYSVKARALVHAHLSRLQLPPETLEVDKRYVLKKCPYLINEMVSIVAQLVALKHAGRVNHEPRLETLEHCMKLSQMIVQALWDSRSPLLQLPHIKEDSLRHFVTKKRNIRNIQQFVNMKDEDRRLLLRNMSEREYQDVMNVCATMPMIDMEVRSEVLDDEDKTITAGSIITVTVQLRRENLSVLFNKEDFADNVEKDEENSAAADDDEEKDKEKDKEKVEEQKESQKPKVWQKQKKKGKGPAKKKKTANKVNKKAVVPEKSPNSRVEEEEKSTPEPNGRVPKAKRKQVRDENESSDEDRSDLSDLDDSEAEGGGEGGKGGVGDEDDWQKFQEEAKRENALETKSKETHLVHCPFFPAGKHEWWWLYIADRRTKSLITAPVQVTSLKSDEQVQLKVSAPHKPGSYQYSVILRSDSYIDFDQFKHIKLEVKEAKKIENHPQWDISDEEEEEEAHGDDDYTDSEVSTDDESE